MLRHFIDTQDFSKAELLDMIELTRRIKAADRQGCTPKLLQDASLAMIFEEPSTRTRVSFEVAMTELGGHALYLKPGEIHLGVRESMYDTAKVLSRMCDGIFARTLKHATITELATACRGAGAQRADRLQPPHAGGLRCDHHDRAHAGGQAARRPEGDLHRRRHQRALLADADLHPDGHALHPRCADTNTRRQPSGRPGRRRTAAESGGSLTVTDDPVAAVREADFIYTDLWWWVGQEDQIPERRAAFMPDYQVNLALFNQAPAHCKFMHCLPASRGVEATDEVMDHPRSIIFDQSENRLHTEKGLLVYFLYPG